MNSPRLPVPDRPSLTKRIRSDQLDQTTPEKRTGDRTRAVSFVASAGLHCLGIVILGLLPGSEKVAQKSIYEDVIQSQAHKIIWYDFRKHLPDVVGTKRVGPFPKPRGTAVSRQVMIATSSKPKSKKQFIWQPAPKIEIREDLPLPNLIARTKIALPPLPVGLRRKLDRANAMGVRSVQPNISPTERKGDPDHAPDSPNNGITLTPRKAFVPPPQVKRQARLSTPATILDAPMPDSSIFGSPKMKSALPEGLGAPTFSQGSAPPPDAPVGPTRNVGNAKVDLAIASLNPAEKLNGPLPEGTRSGGFSKAPISGAAPSGDGSGSAALIVPHLSIHEDRSKSGQAPDVNANRRPILYAEKVRSIPVTTLSVPLRPSSRTIPSAIDARFQSRTIYTMLVPIENLPAYTGDWILWFAERDPQPGDTPSIRAPIPFQKLEPVDAVLSRVRIEWRLQIAAVIRKDGKLDAMALLTKADRALEQAVIQDVASWEFKPATRDGVPVDVDIIIEVPFNWAPEIAKGQP